uniref:Fumarylacetoacetate hydrolase n=1 Tax=Heterorhabditis bacteriophora TaxID=37862 RepID=A0A1I7X796_HETBA
MFLQVGDKVLTDFFGIGPIEDCNGVVSSEGIGGTLYQLVVSD